MIFAKGKTVAAAALLESLPGHLGLLIGMGPLEGQTPCCPPWAEWSGSYLGGQQPGQVDLGHHLAAPVTLLLVSVVMVLHQMPHLDPTLQVRGDHGGP